MASPRDRSGQRHGDARAWRAPRTHRCETSAVRTHRRSARQGRGRRRSSRSRPHECSRDKNSTPPWERPDRPRTPGDHPSDRRTPPWTAVSGGRRSPSDPDRPSRPRSPMTRGDAVAELLDGPVARRLLPRSRHRCHLPARGAAELRDARTSVLIESVVDLSVDRRPPPTSSAACSTIGSQHGAVDSSRRREPSSPSARGGAAHMQAAARALRRAGRDGLGRDDGDSGRRSGATGRGARRRTRRGHR